MPRKILPFYQQDVRIKVEFWSTLEHKKLHELKLSTEAVPLACHYKISGKKGSQQLEVREAAFDPSLPVDLLEVALPGELHNANTWEDFERIRTQERVELLASKCTEMYESIVSGSWKANPGSLSPLLVVSFADLKAHHFHYIVATPALCPKEKDKQFEVESLKPVKEVFEGSTTELLSQCYEYITAGAGRGHAAFLLRRTQASQFQLSGFDGLSPDDREALEKEELVLVFVDPCAAADGVGWPLRNLLLAVAVETSFKSVTAVLLRDSGSSTPLEGSMVLRCAVAPDGLPRKDQHQPGKIPPQVKPLGWKKPGQVAGEAWKVDLSEFMDDKKLAQSSANLNLNLMKWRMVPSLDLDLIARTKCLLVGSGTLGCNVARNLMMWGIHDITFIDRGRVSFSNPVRQCLFTHEDSLDGGKNKAEACAAACHRIYPLSRAKAVDMSVPMPGHPVSQVQEVRAACEKLHELIREHDIIFLLMDSRESRWLPTLLATAEHKPVINAALGFDSYMVMRHGLPDRPEPVPDRPSMTFASRPGPRAATGCSDRLGCYFCSDVTAPANSLADRTLDQQCTVTRGGVSAIASALAVEMTVSMLSHPQGAYAPPPREGDDAAGLLGSVPHQVRGRLMAFEQMLLQGGYFPRCVACSPAVVEAFRQRGFEFLLEVFNNGDKLAEVSGAKAEQEESERRMAEIMDFDDFDDDDED